ncbi:acyltransferase [Streptomyces sp. TG1A-8]|uniref:acyltransferase n=1 Tax=Streptomyces sp. TG1A-8 TaxID=3051385 RepID=UPI00265BE1E6|nr:acyltransferase [Streptomyces sp. TG1A-8]MDO0924378.1 acyltransferase [Streptomyces sp. TG1A-8]
MHRQRARSVRTAVDSRADSVHTVRTGHAGGDRVRLSGFDLLTGPWYIPLTFFYRKTLDAEALRDSLARTLRHYPVLAGRLRRDADGGLSVVCDDAGVRFTEAWSPDAMGDFGHDLRSEPVAGNLVREVTAFGVVDRDTPLLKIRLTQMRGGGSVLAVMINHTLADGASALSFLQNWSHEHLGLPWEKPNHAREVLDSLGRPSPSAAVREGRALVTVGRLRRLAATARLAARRLTTVTTRFHAAELAAMKEDARASLPGSGAWVSTNDTLTAHLWRVYGQLRERPADAPEWLGLVVGARTRLGGELPAGYWGNCVSSSWTSTTAAALRTASLGALALGVRRCLESTTEDKLRDEIAFLNSLRRKGISRRVMSARAHDAFDASLSVNNWSRFPLYGVDLGGGRPFWYEFPDVPVPTVHITPTPDEDGGRDVYLCLLEEHAGELAGPGWQARLHPFR